MEIECEFEDDFFETAKGREVKETSTYKAKVCTPLWYMEAELSGKEDSEVLAALKHQADLHYSSFNYVKAVEVYERCLELVPSSNNTWKREFMENLSHSLLHMGNADKALEWGLKLYASSCNSDQKVVSMNLLATVCHKLGKYKEELEALHCCLEVHKNSPEFWMRLGYCYAGLFKIELPNHSILKSVIDLQDTEPCCAFKSKIPCQTDDEKDPTPLNSGGVSNSKMPQNSSLEIAIASSSSCAQPLVDESVEGPTPKCQLCSLGLQIVSTCLIQTRVLIDSGGYNALKVEKNARIKQTISNSLKHMEVSQSVIDEASKMLGSDFLSGLQQPRDNSLLTNCSPIEKIDADDVWKI